MPPLKHAAPFVFLSLLLLSLSDAPPIQAQQVQVTATGPASEGASGRTRPGLHGAVGASRPAARTRAEQLYEALLSPVPAGEMRLRVTPVFSSHPQKGPFISSLVHLDMRQVSFVEEADGSYKAIIDLLVHTVGDNGEVVDEVDRTETVRVRGEDLRRVIEDGLVYIMAVPVRRPGPYQLRVAVRDAVTERLGSARQSIEVPDLTNKRLALSSLVMEESGYATAPGHAAGAPIAEPDPMGSAAVRRFRRGARIAYHFDIYNAKLNSETGRPLLRTQVRILSGDRPVFTGQVANLSPEGAEGPPGAETRVKTMGRLRLGMDLPPGVYVLQVHVADALAGADHSTAARVEFEIVE